MKTIVHIIALLTLNASAATYAAELSCSFSTLPPTVYVITGSSEGGAPGTSSILEVSRSNTTMVAIFSSKGAADAFLNTLADAPGNKRAASAFPKSFARDFQRHGAHLILDPVTLKLGGTPVASDAEKGPEAKDNPELTAICDEDQADRGTEAGKVIDWSVLGPRDAKRLARVKELYHDAKIVTGPDYYHAALVMQHGTVPEDFLLSHEFAIVAITKGYAGNAAWLAAASEDRFLKSIGRVQRFGTQLSDPIVVDGSITDGLREELNVPSLLEEQELARRINPKGGPNKATEPMSPAVTPPAGAGGRANGAHGSS